MTLKPSLEDYRELGAELSFLCDRLTKLSCKLGRETGTAKKPYKNAKEAIMALDKCKSEVEELMFSHYPELGREGIKVFYGEIKLPPDLQRKDP